MLLFLSRTCPSAAKARASRLWASVVTFLSMAARKPQVDVATPRGGGGGGRHAGLARTIWINGVKEALPKHGHKDAQDAVVNVGLGQLP